MFGSAILETAIGVVFVFLLVSLVCTSVREALESVLRARAAFLERGIRELLQARPEANPASADAAATVPGADLVSKIYNHPLVYALFSGEYVPRKRGRSPGALDRGDNLPSYIPARTFVNALVDIVTRADDPEAAKYGRNVRVDFAAVRAGLAKIDNAHVRHALMLALDDAAGDLDMAKRNLEAWFDTSMERVSGWYKRASQHVLFVIGLVLAIAMNVDAIAIAKHLYAHDAVRAVVVAVAEQQVKTQEVAPDPPVRDGKARETLESLALPIGWDGDASMPTTTREWLRWLVGILVTAFAAMLGAPFWFDVLNKIMVVRSTLKPGAAASKTDPPADSASTNRSPVSSPAAPAQVTVGPSDHDHGAPPAAAPVDTCDVDMALDPTPDEDLPPARGGVAAA